MYMQFNYSLTLYFLYRNDGQLFELGTTLMISGPRPRGYKISLNVKQFQDTFLGICEAGVKFCTKKGKLIMWHIGSSIGAAQFTMF